MGGVKSSCSQVSMAQQRERDPEKERWLRQTEAEAKQAAIAELRGIFSSSDQLAARVASYRADFDKKKVTILSEQPLTCHGSPP